MDRPVSADAGPPSEVSDEPQAALGEGASDAGAKDEADVLPDTETRQRRKRRSATRTAIEWVLLVGAALLIAFLIKTFLFQAFWIPSDSMVPTLVEGDRVLVNKLSYRLHDVNRGDVVVFRAPENTGDGINDLVKRVVGLPGDSVEGIDGQIYVDGRALEEPYLPEGTISRTFPAITVPPDTIFVLGDNRLNSRDSTVFGPVPVDDIVGRVFVRIWPPSRIGFF